MSECIDHGCKGYGLGYATAWIKLPCGTKKPTTRHRRVYYEATGELPEVVRHKCDNARCINIDHLEGGTQKDNMQDCARRGRLNTVVTRGEDHASTKLTYKDVQDIRRTYVKSSRLYGLPALAKKYGVGTSQLFRIITGESRVDC